MTARMLVTTSRIVAIAFCLAAALLTLPAIAQQWPDCQLEAIEASVHGSRHQMPNLVGCQVAGIELALRRLDHPVSRSTVHSVIAAGQITRTDPPAGVNLRPNTQITLFVSDGHATESSSSVTPAFVPGSKTTPELVRRADVSVKVTLGSGEPFVIGQIVEYRIYVENLGPDRATGVQAHFAAENIDNVDLVTPCTGQPCTLGDLGPTTTATIVLRAKIVRDGQFGLTARVTHAESDPRSDNDTATQTAYARPNTSTSSKASSRTTVDLLIKSKLLTPPPHYVGEEVEFEAMIRNESATAVGDVRLDESLSNLDSLRIIGGCPGLGCTIAKIPAAYGVKRSVRARIRAEGAFSYDMAASAANARSNRAIAADFASLKADSPLGPRLVALTIVLIGCGAASVAVRRMMWRKRLLARVINVERGIMKLTKEPPLTLPTISVRTEIGVASVTLSGPVHVIKEELQHE